MQLLLLSAIKDNKTAQKFVRLRRIGMKFLDCFFIFLLSVNLRNSSNPAQAYKSHQ